MALGESSFCFFPFVPSVNANTLPKNFVFAMIAPIMISEIAWKTYLVFTCINAVSIPVLYFFVPELKNLSLEQVDLVFTCTSGTATDTNPVKEAARLQRILREQGRERGQEIMLDKINEAVGGEVEHREITVCDVK